jgi:hypothetical protein
MTPQLLIKRCFSHWLLLLSLTICVRVAQAAPEGEVNLLLFGDWGASLATSDPDETATDLAAHRREQRRTAKAMGDWLAKDDLAGKMDGLLLLGDNFYGKLSGVDDPRWKTTFLDHFTPDLFPMNLYVVMGNHDFEDGSGMNWRAEIDYARQGKDKRWLFPTDQDGHTWYRLDLPNKLNPIVTIMVFNTSSDALDSYAKKWKIEGWQAQKEWLAAQIKQESKAQWLTGAGHYPMFTNGHHFPDTLKGGKDHSPWEKGRKDLMKPLLEAGAQFWLGAHDHNLQFLHDASAPKMEFVVSGGGGGSSLYKNPGKGAKVAKGDIFARGPGWVWMTFTKDKAITRFYKVNYEEHPADPSKDTLSLLHTFERTLGSDASIHQN